MTTVLSFPVGAVFQWPPGAVSLFGTLAGSTKANVDSLNPVRFGLTQTASGLTGTYTSAGDPGGAIVGLVYGLQITGSFDRRSSRRYGSNGKRRLHGAR